MPDAAAPFQGSHRAYDSIVRPNVLIPARDGVPLAADIYLPAHNGQVVDGAFPAIVERTPYLKDGTNYARRGHWYARRGYATVINDVRGRGQSSGEWYPFALEAPDGFDVVEWVAAQPWCNGRVGTMGASYAGSDQSALATLDPPHLACQVVGQGTSNYHVSSLRQGGALEQRFIRYAFRMARTSREALADPRPEAHLRRRRSPDPGALRATAAFPPRPDSLAPAPHLRAMGLGHPDPRRLRRVLDAAGLHHRPLLGRALGRAGAIPERLVRHLSPRRDRQLPRPQRAQVQPHAARDGPLAAWRGHGRGEHRRRRPARHRRRRAGLRRHAAALLRRALEGSTPGCAARRRFDTSSWAAARGAHPPTSTHPCGMAGAGRMPPRGRLRNTRSGRCSFIPTDRYSRRRPRAGTSRAVTPTTRAIPCRPPVGRSAPRRTCCLQADSTSAGSRAVSSDTATRCRWHRAPTCCRSRRRRWKADLEIAGPVEVRLFAASTAVDTDFTAKAARCLSPRPRRARQHARRLRAESLRQHHPRALSQWIRVGAIPHARRDLRVSDHPVSDRESLFSRASHSG